jgi:hypothetical protein
MGKRRVKIKTGWAARCTWKLSGYLFVFSQNFTSLFYGKRDDN